MQADYENMSSWIEHQQRHIQQLEAENRDLRRQLDDLRRGVGVAVLINGRALPIAPQPPSYPSQPSADPTMNAQYLPPRQPATAQPYGPPPMPGATWQSPMPLSAHMPFPENTWLTDTGSIAALPSLPPLPSQGDFAEPRQLVSSQEMTPTWLRDSVQDQQPAPFPYANGPTPAQLRTPAPLYAKPAAPRTLSHITGQQPAVRLRHPVNPHHPSPESFVLE